MDCSSNCTVAMILPDESVMDRMLSAATPLSTSELVRLSLMSCCWVSLSEFKSPGITRASWYTGVVVVVVEVVVVEVVVVDVVVVDVDVVVVVVVVVVEVVVLVVVVLVVVLVVVEVVVVFVVVDVDAAVVVGARVVVVVVVVGVLGQWAKLGPRAGILPSGQQPYAELHCVEYCVCKGARQRNKKIQVGK